VAERKKSTSLRRVERGIYERHGKYLVPIWDRQTRRKTYTHPDHPRGGFARLKDARAYKLAREEAKDRHPSSRVLCDDFAKRWRRDTHLKSESTNINSQAMVKRFTQDFAGVFMDEVTRKLARLYIHGGPVPPDLERYARQWEGVDMQDGRMVAPGRKAAYKWIRVMWNDAVDDEVRGVARNPFAALGVETGNGRRGCAMLTSEELDLLVESAGDEWGDWGRLMIGPMIRVAAGTGMRPGEQHAMRWHWVDFDAGEITVKGQLQQRTGRETLPKGWELRQRRGLDPTRRIVMLPMVRAALEQLRELRRVDDDHVFFTQTGKVFHQRTHWFYWGPVRARFHKRLPADRRVEIDPGFDYYELRHWFGSYLAGLRGPHGEVLMSAEDIADQMGNRPEEVQRTYVHTPSEDARDRVRRAVLLDMQRAAG
jgi:integrase